jgi:hypothetical protein
MFLRQSYRAALSLLLLLAVTHCPAQQAAPTIDAVLARVRENASEFKKSVPGFVSDESVLSQRFVNDKLKDEMKMESSFEVKPRGTGEVKPRGTGEMDESRTIRQVNGKTAKSQKVVPPFVSADGYADALLFVDDKCLADSLGEVQGADKTILVLGTPKPASTDCHYVPSFSMKVLVDPQSFQILRLEYTVQDCHIHFWLAGIIESTAFVPCVISKDKVMTVVTEYAQVELGGKTFWLPKTVTSDLKDKDDRKKPEHLHYEAHYTNYRFAVSSTILPGNVVQTQN